MLYNRAQVLIGKKGSLSLFDMEEAHKFMNM